MEADLTWFVWVMLVMGVTILIAVIYSIIRCCAVCIEPSPIVQRYLFFRQSERGDSIPSGRSRLVSVCEIYPHALHSSMFGRLDEKPGGAMGSRLGRNRMPSNVVILCPNSLRSAGVPSYLDAPPPAYETVVPVDCSVKTRGLQNV